MEIKGIRHKGLKRFVEKNETAGLPAAYVEKIRNILAFLQDMDGADELKSIASWRAHQLSGGRRGTWALHVTPDWRITFQIDETGLAITELNYEDYH